MKKIILVIFISLSCMFANNLNLNISDEFQEGASWDIGMEAEGTYYLMLPMDVDYSSLQSTLSDDAYLQVYRWYQNKDLFEADFGVKSLVIVKVEKTLVSYYVYNPDDAAYINVGNTYSEVKDYLENNIATKITDDTKKSIFLNSYVPSLDKINKNKLYLVKPRNSGLNISININGSTTTPDDIEMPPMPPELNTNSTSDIITPPSPPEL